MTTILEAGIAVAPSAAERARHWAKLPAAARVKYERLAADVRGLEASQQAVWQTILEVRTSKGRAEQRLEAMTDPRLPSKGRPAPQVVQDIGDEIAYLVNRLVTLEAEHEAHKLRWRNALRLLNACKKHLGITGDV